MPLISTFFGIIIRMNWKDIGQHKEPHVHAEYAGQEAVFSLTGNILAGSFPERQTAFVKAWILLHESELQENWNKAVHGEQVTKIPPLQ